MSWLRMFSKYSYETFDLYIEWIIWKSRGTVS
jgi:hypothetical protein